MKSELTINEDGTKEWKLPNGELHREDAPGVEYIGGNKYWYINGKLHRENGPAIEYRYGDKEWYINGTKYTEQEYKIEMRSIKLIELLK
jgi:hypothetical protein